MGGNDKPERLIEGAFLCDHAAEYGGRLCVLGAFANLAWAPSLPALHQAHLVVRFGWVGATSEAFDLHLVVRVTGPDRSQLLEFNASGRLQKAEGGFDDVPGGTTIIVPLLIPLQQEGVHHVHVEADGQLDTVLPLKVILGQP